MAILDFSVSGLCRQHAFGSITQFCFGISVSNFMCMSFVAVGRSLTIFSYVIFKMVALWFWKLLKCNPPIAPYYPLLWGGGILVDHWSTISSFKLKWIELNLIKMYLMWVPCHLPSILCEGDRDHWMWRSMEDHNLQGPVSIWIGSFQVWDSRYKDKIVMRPSYL